MLRKSWEREGCLKFCSEDSSPDLLSSDPSLKHYSFIYVYFIVKKYKKGFGMHTKMGIFRVPTLWVFVRVTWDDSHKKFSMASGI